MLFSYDVALKIEWSYFYEQAVSDGWMDGWMQRNNIGTTRQLQQHMHAHTHTQTHACASTHTHTHLCVITFTHRDILLPTATADSHNQNLLVKKMFRSYTA